MLTLITRASLIALLAGLLQLVTITPANSAPPVGQVDTISSPAPGRVTVSGYAYDPDDPAKHVEIQVNVPDTTGTNIGPANLPDAMGGDHGFKATIPVYAAGELPYIVYALDPQGGAPTRLDGGQIFVADTLTGAVESPTSTVHRTIDVSGWASDSDSPSSAVRIEAFVGGNAGTPGAEGTVLSAATLRGDGNLGFSGRLTTAKTGTQPVYIWAKNLPGTAGVDRLIAQLSVDIYVDSSPPETTITSAPRTATTDDLIHVEFTADEPNSTFQCRWDEEPWFDCAGGTAVKLTVGNHRIAVRATDAYDNQDTSPAVWVVTVTQAPTPTDPNAPTNPDSTQTGRSIVAKAVKKKSRLRINVGPDSATTNYRVIIQRKVGKKWRKITRTRTRGPKDIVTINLKRGTYRAVLPKSSAGKALRSNTIRLKR